MAGPNLKDSTAVTHLDIGLDIGYWIFGYNIQNWILCFTNFIVCLYNSRLFFFIGYITAFVTFLTAAGVTWNKVVQIPKHLKVNRGANASIFCIFPIFQDMPYVRWWKRGEQSFLKPDSRKRFDTNKGSSSFEFLNVTFADSGVYYCIVKYPGKSNETGTGTQLTVYVHPTPLEIVPIEENSATSLRIECKTAAFYPEDLNISWQRDGVEILAGIETVRNETMDGLFEVSSSLEEAQPLQNGVVFTCLASHISLKVPASINYIVNQAIPGIEFTLIFGCAGGALAVVLLIIILTRLKLKASAGFKKNSMESGQSDEVVQQGPNKEIVAYASLNLKHDNGSSKRRHETEHTVYSQTKQSGDNKLTYATLQLADFKKTSKAKQQDKHVEYAEVNMTEREKLKI